MIVRPQLHDPKKISMEELFRGTQLVNDILFEEDPQMVIMGVVQVIDLQGSTANHMFQMTPQLIKKAMIIWQVCLLSNSTDSIGINLLIILGWISFAS